ncbi:hypothetical protein [Streptomyces sp. NPDC048638]|uniref:hypothetical protein n=1 Tax=Streptomyces sp. NPDC048638 TaxID=3365580 RepID=UPI0037152D2B
MFFTVTGRFGDQDAQALAVTGDGPLGSLDEVVPQVPSVGNLSRLGASAVVPSAKNGARSRQTTSMPGCLASHFARLDVSRSGSRSIGRRVSTSTRTVP